MNDKLEDLVEEMNKLFNQVRELPVTTVELGLLRLFRAAWQIVNHCLSDGIDDSRPFMRAWLGAYTAANQLQSIHETKRSAHDSSPHVGSLAMMFTKLWQELESSFGIDEERALMIAVAIGDEHAAAAQFRNAFRPPADLN